jgi:hypothetical protein
MHSGLAGGSDTQDDTCSQSSARLSPHRAIFDNREREGPLPGDMIGDLAEVKRLQRENKKKGSKIRRLEAELAYYQRPPDSTSRNYV